MESKNQSDKKSKNQVIKSDKKSKNHGIKESK